MACFSVVLAMSVFCFTMPGYGQNAQPAVSCASLGKLTLPNTTITTAQEYAAGEFKMPARSAVLRRAAAEYLKRARSRGITEKYRRAYADGDALESGFEAWAAESVRPEE
jgi:hypothetical protein